MEGTPILVKLSFQVKVPKRKRITKIAFNLVQALLELIGLKGHVLIVVMIMRTPNHIPIPNQSGSSSSRK